MTVDYPKITAVLIESVKELKKEIDTIKESLNIKNPCQTTQKNKFLVEKLNWCASNYGGDMAPT